MGGRGREMFWATIIVKVRVRDRVRFGVRVEDRLVLARGRVTVQDQVSFCVGELGRC